MRQAYTQRDVSIPADAPTHLVVDKHKNYLERYGEDVDSYEFAMAEYLRISGMFWSVTCLDLLHALDTSQRFNRDAVIIHVKSCHKLSGGFAPHPDHGDHLLHTLSAAGNQRGRRESLRGGSPAGEWEFCGRQVGRGGYEVFDVRAGVFGTAGPIGRVCAGQGAGFIRQCQNFDGGFGTGPGAESHAGMIYCCVGSLAILGRLDIVEVDKLGLWLAKSQLPSGGLNGRPEKTSRCLLLMVGVIFLGYHWTTALDRREEAHLLHFGQPGC